MINQDVKTALDDYVAKPDPSYSWREIAKYDVEGCTIYILNMTSQRWMTGK